MGETKCSSFEIKNGARLLLCSCCLLSNLCHGFSNPLGTFSLKMEFFPVAGIPRLEFFHKNDFKRHTCYFTVAV